MDFKRLKIISMVAGTGSLGLTALVFAGAVAPAAGQTAALSASTATVLPVTIGTPTERTIKLSKSSAIPLGKVTFRVTNRGKSAHDFKVCTAVIANAQTNACEGLATKRLAPGGTANLTVNFRTTGTYQFLSTSSGGASRGTKGLLRIGATGAASQTAGTPTTITAAGRTITARLNNTAVARDFLAMLPVTLPWFRNSEIEYITELDSPLTEAGPFYTNVRPGDIVYYNPLDSVTIIYEETSSVPTLTKMGEITSDLSVFDGLPDKTEMAVLDRLSEQSDAVSLVPNRSRIAAEGWCGATAGHGDGVVYLRTEGRLLPQGTIGTPWPRHSISQAQRRRHEEANARKRSGGLLHRSRLHGLQPVLSAVSGSPVPAVAPISAPATTAVRLSTSIART